MPWPSRDRAWAAEVGPWVRNYWRPSRGAVHHAGGQLARDFRTAQQPSGGARRPVAVAGPAAWPGLPSFCAPRAPPTNHSRSNLEVPPFPQVVRCCASLKTYYYYYFKKYCKNKKIGFGNKWDYKKLGQVQAICFVVFGLERVVYRNTNRTIAVKRWVGHHLHTWLPWVAKQNARLLPNLVRVGWGDVSELGLFSSWNFFWVRLR